MVLKFKNFISGHIKVFNTVNFGGLLLIFLFVVIFDIKVALWILIGFLGFYNLVFLISFLFYKDYLLIHKDKIIISGHDFEDVIYFTDVRRVVFHKNRWHDYLVSDYFAGEFVLFFKDNRKEYEKIVLTNSQFRKVRQFIQRYHIEVEIRLR